MNTHRLTGLIEDWESNGRVAQLSGANPNVWHICAEQLRAAIGTEEESR